MPLYRRIYAALSPDGAAKNDTNQEKKNERSNDTDNERKSLENV